MSEENQEIEEIDEVLDDVESKQSSIRPNFSDVTKGKTSKPKKATKKPNFSKLSKDPNNSKKKTKDPSYDFDQFATTSIEKAKEKSIELGESFNLSKSDNNLNKLYSKIKQQRDYNIAKKRAEQQGFFGEFGGFLAQSAAEIVGGTIEGVGYLLDLQALSTGQYGEGNWFSNLGTSLKDWTREVAPIHMDPDTEGKFAPWSKEWWFKNGVSVSSALSIMIPVAGWTRGIALGAKGLKAISGAAKAARASRMASKGAKINDAVRSLPKYEKTFDALFGKAGAKRLKNATHQALVSRHIESNMEAAGVYQEEYDRVLAETGDKTLAKNAASEAAAMSYNLNSAMLLQDIPQYFLLGRSMKASKAFNSFKAAKAAGASTAKAFATSGYRRGLDMLSEAGEEAYQFVVGEESKHFGDVIAGIADDSNFSSRFGEYIRDGEFWTSSFFGGIGAAVMQGAKPVFDAIAGKQDSRITEMEERGAKRAYYNKKLREAAELTPDIYEQSVMNASVDMAVTAAKEGNLKHYYDELESLKNADAETLEKMGVDEEFVKNIERLQEDALAIEKIWDDNINRFDPAVLPYITESKFIISKLDKQRADIIRNIQNTKNSIPGINELSAEGAQVFESQLEILAAKRTVEASKKILATKEDLTEEERQEYEEFITKREAEIKEAEDAIEQILADDVMLPLKDRQTLELIGDHKLKPNPIISETISNREKLKWQDALIDSHVKRLNKLNSDEIIGVASQNKAAREKNKKDFRRVQELYSLIHKGAKEETVAKKKTELDAFGKEVPEELQDEKFKHAVTDDDGFTRAYGSPLSIQEKADAIAEAEEILERTTDETDKESIQKMIDTMKDIVDGQKDRWSKQNKRRLLQFKIEQQQAFVDRLTNLVEQSKQDVEGFKDLQEKFKKELETANKERTDLLVQRLNLIPGSADYEENVVEWRLVNSRINKLSAGIDWTAESIDTLYMEELYSQMNMSNLIDYAYEDVTVENLFIEETDVLPVFMHGEKGILYKDPETKELIFQSATTNKETILSGGGSMLTLGEMDIQVIKDSIYPLDIQINPEDPGNIILSLNEHEFTFKGMLPEESLNYDAIGNLESVTVLNKDGKEVTITNEVLKYEIADLLLTYQVSILEPFQYSQEAIEVPFYEEVDEDGNPVGEPKLYTIDINFGNITESKVYVKNKNGDLQEILINQSHRNKAGKLNRKGQLIQFVYKRLSNALSEKVSNIEASYKSVNVLNEDSKPITISIVGHKKTFNYNEKAKPEDIPDQPDQGPGPKEDPSQDEPTGKGTPPFENEAELTGSSKASSKPGNSFVTILSSAIEKSTLGDEFLNKLSGVKNIDELNKFIENQKIVFYDAFRSQKGGTEIDQVELVSQLNFLKDLLDLATSAATSTTSSTEVPWPKFKSPEITYGTTNYELPGGKTITFNTQQEDALTKIQNWLDKGKETAFTLEGYAGTGKTTISKKIIDDTISNLPKGQSLMVSAPTHKSKRVIKKATNKEASTIHQLLGLKPSYDINNFDPNKLQFEESGIDLISNPGLKFIVIDEASMINSKLYNYLIEKAKEKKIKILFMGDRAQIPPIGEELSEVFNNPNRVQLTWVERTAGDNPLIGLFTHIRDNIKSERLPYQATTMLNSEGKGVEFTKNWNKKIKEIFSNPEYKENPDFAKVVAWTNDRVNQLNAKIREIVWPDADDIIVVGETLVGNTATDNVFNSVENGKEYKVLKVDRKEEKRSDMDGKAITIKSLNVTYFDEDFKENRVLSVLDHSDPTTLKFYKENLSRIFSAIDNAKTKKERNKIWRGMYYPFIEKNILLKDVRINDRRYVSRHLSYPYASTAHKAQGSTYANTFIDEVNIGKNKNSFERNRILYTALSRTSNNAYVLTDREISVAVPDNPSNNPPKSSSSSQNKQQKEAAKKAKDFIEGLKKNREFIKGKTKAGKIVEVDEGVQFDKYVKLDPSGNIIAEFDRVSEFIKGKTKQTALLKTASPLGNKVDAIVRDFFKGELKGVKDYNVSNAKEFNKFVTRLNDLKQYFESRGEIPVTDTIVLYDEGTGVAGTIDLITYDKNGNVRLYDVKTMKGNKFIDSYRGSSISKYEDDKYGLSDNDSHRKQLSLYRLLLSKDANFPLTAELKGFIIPVVLDYNTGDKTSKELTLLTPDDIPNLPEITKELKKKGRTIGLKVHSLDSRVTSHDGKKTVTGRPSKKKGSPQPPRPSNRTNQKRKGGMSEMMIKSAPNNFFDTVNKDGAIFLRFDKDENPVPKDNPGGIELLKDLIANPNLVKAGTQVRFTVNNNDYFESLKQNEGRNADTLYKHAPIVVSIKVYDESLGREDWKPIQILESSKETSDNLMHQPDVLRKAIYEEILANGEAFGEIKEVTTSLEGTDTVQIGPSNLRNVLNSKGEAVVKPLSERFNSAYQMVDGKIVLVRNEDVKFELATTEGHPYLGEVAPALDVGTLSSKKMQDDLAGTEIFRGLGHVFAAVMNPNGNYSAVKLSTSTVDMEAVNKIMSNFMRNENIEDIKEIIYADYSVDEIVGLTDNLRKHAIRINESKGKYYVEWHRAGDDFYSIDVENISRDDAYNYVAIKTIDKITKEGKTTYVLKHNSQKSQEFAENLKKEEFNVEQQLRDIVKIKKYNVSKNLLATEIPYTSKVTGKTYNSYKDYLSGRKDSNGKPNNEVPNAAILQTDVQPSNGNYFYSSGMQFSYTPQEKTDTTKAPEKRDTGRPDDPSATVRPGTRSRKRNKGGTGLNNNAGTTGVPSRMDPVITFMRKWNMNQSGFTMGTPPAFAQFKNDAKNNLGLDARKAKNGHAYLVDPSGRALINENSPFNKKISVNSSKVIPSNEKYPYNTTRLSSGRFLGETTMTPQRWAELTDKEKEYIIRCN